MHGLYKHKETLDWAEDILSQEANSLLVDNIDDIVLRMYKYGNDKVGPTIP